MKYFLPKLVLSAVLGFGALTFVDAQSPTRSATAYDSQLLASTASTTEVTHLGVDVGRMVMLKTGQVSSGVPSQLFFDGYWNAPFSVPQGYVFVATDIIIAPLNNGAYPKIYGTFNVNGSLRYPIQHVGEGSTAHSLQSGLVVRPDDSPTISAYTSNTHVFYVTVTGYFVKGTGHVPGTPFNG